jgi:Ca2+-binding EF-hand superfamily protein
MQSVLEIVRFVATRLCCPTRARSGSRSNGGDSEDFIQKVLSRVGSYSKNGEVVGDADLKKLMKDIGIPDQIQTWVEFYKNKFGSRVSLKNVEGLLRSQSKPSLLAAELAKQIDKNNDGTVSNDEFDSVYELLCTKWPALKGKTYEDFLQAADADQSGHVDIQEFITWIESISS